MHACIEPLHLTEANRECLRHLIRSISPHFEEELWEKVNLQKAIEAEKARLNAESLRAQAQMNTTSHTGYGGGGGASSVIFTSGPPVGSVTVYGGGGGGGGSVNILNPGAGPITLGSTAPYVSHGTGFTAYDANSIAEASRLMGLGKTGGGWSK